MRTWPAALSNGFPAVKTTLQRLPEHAGSEANLKAHFPLSATRSYQAAQTGFPEPVREQPKNSREILFVNHTTETVLPSGDFVCFVLLLLSHPVDEAGSRRPLMLHSREILVKPPSRVVWRAALDRRGEEMHFTSRV